MHFDCKTPCIAFSAHILKTQVCVNIFYRHLVLRNVILSQHIYVSGTHKLEKSRFRV